MRCVFLFSSIHHVMRSEKILKGKGIEVALIPVPREISSDCGVAIEVSSETEERTGLLLGEHRIPILACYRRIPEGTFEKRK